MIHTSNENGQFSNWCVFSLSLNEKRVQHFTAVFIQLTYHLYYFTFFTSN